jgi:hypothetical protein
MEHGNPRVAETLGSIAAFCFKQRRESANMRPSNHPGHILPQDTQPGDANEEVNLGQPVSLTEIEDLLYGDDRPAEHRLERLRELAEELRARAAGDIADDDAGVVLEEVERAIATLVAKSQFVGEPGALDEDPLAHRETLAPDSDELEEIEEEDEESVEEDIGKMRS